MSNNLRTLTSKIKADISTVVSLFPSFLKARIKGTSEYHARLMLKVYDQGLSLDRNNGNILFWVPGGMPLMLHVEGAIAIALRIRGFPVHAIICDGPFRACVKREIKDGIPVRHWQGACIQCKSQTSAVLDSMGIPYSYIGDFVPESKRTALWEMTAFVTWDMLDDLSYESINVGKNARSAIVRYLQGHDLAGYEEIVHEYAFSALMSAAAASCAIDRLSPSRIFMSHGIYVDWGPALHTALARRIPVAAWMATYLQFRFYFRHIEDGIRIDFHNMSSAAWEECRCSDMVPTQNSRLDMFIEGRYKKNIGFGMKLLKKYNGATDQLRQKYAPKSNKPVWGIMAHINWDAVSDSSPMAYSSFDDWMLDTISEVVNIPDVQWLIKVHPAEAWNNPASGVQCLIERYFPSLPSHVRIILAEEEISPLDFFQMIDGGVTVYGTSGLELALLGKPVILAGQAHYGGKGFTYDGLTPEDYKQLLRKAESLKQITEEQRQLARRYAYCYFIQRQVPFPVVRDPNSIWWSFQYDKRHLLLPGRDSFVDFICEKLLDGKDFIMDEKLVALSEKENEELK